MSIYNQTQRHGLANTETAGGGVPKRHTPGDTEEVSDMYGRADDENKQHLITYLPIPTNLC